MEQTKTRSTVVSLTKRSYTHGQMDQRLFCLRDSAKQLIIQRICMRLR